VKVILGVNDQSDADFFNKRLIETDKIIRKVDSLPKNIE
jgi:hypothetical protein